MTTDATAELAPRIDAAVRAIPGVETLYRPGALVSTVIDAGAVLLGVREEPVTLVAVRSTPEGIEVDISVGVNEAHGAATTVRAVADTVRALLAIEGHESAVVRVTVAHVDESARAAAE